MAKIKKHDKTKTIRVILPLEIYEWINDKAIDDSRKISAMVRLMLERQHNCEIK